MTSLRTPRWRAASSDNLLAMSENESQSVFASHGGGIAWLKACTNGCMSVDDRSYFSYQVAAGRTMSENSALEVILKSIVVSRSSFPVGACSRHLTSCGRSAAGVSCARTAGSVVPSRCFRKYSWPLPDDPSRLARQMVSTRVKLAGAHGSTPAKLLWSA